MRSVQIGNARLEVVEGDITGQDTEAIVNAANSSLLGGGGVDGAIHRAGGPQILEECRKIGGCPTGEARITGGGRLPPGGSSTPSGRSIGTGTTGEADLLAGAYRNSLRLASERGIKTVAFPSISTGAYGYPMAEAASIALTTAADFLNAHQDIALVRFVLFGNRQRSRRMRLPSPRAFRQHPNNRAAALGTTRQRGGAGCHLSVFSSTPPSSSASAATTGTAAIRTVTASEP